VYVWSLALTTNRRQTTCLADSPHCSLLSTAASLTVYYSLQWAASQRHAPHCHTATVHGRLVAASNPVVAVPARYCSHPSHICGFISDGRRLIYCYEIWQTSAIPFSQLWGRSLPPTGCETYLAFKCLSSPHGHAHFFFRPIECIGQTVVAFYSSPCSGRVNFIEVSTCRSVSP